MKALESKHVGSDAILKEISILKSNVADFIVPILFGEIEHYKGLCEKWSETWTRYHVLDRRIDIKEAMDKFDAQFDALNN